MSEITSNTYCTTTASNDLAYGWSPFTTATATINANQIINDLCSIPESYRITKDEFFTLMDSEAIKEIIELVP